MYLYAYFKAPVWVYTQENTWDVLKIYSVKKSFDVNII